MRRFAAAALSAFLALAAPALAQDITQFSPTLFDGSYFAKSAGKIGLSMSSAGLRGAVTDETGLGLLYFQGGDLGTPSAGVLTNATGLPISTGVSGLGTGVATFLATPSSDDLAAALTDETGTAGGFVRATSPAFLTSTSTQAAAATGLNTVQSYLTSASAERVRITYDGTNVRYGIAVSNTDLSSPHFTIMNGGDVGIGRTSVIVATGGRRFVSIQGATGAGAVELATSQADADGNVIGLAQFTDVNSTAADKRAAMIFATLKGATANNRGGKLSLSTKADAGVLATRMEITETGQGLFAGGFQIGSLTALTLSSGEMGFAKIAASGTAPGAAGGKLAMVCGTNAGTLKLIAYGGTGTTASTIHDNIGSGVTGC